MKILLSAAVAATLAVTSLAAQADGHFFVNGSAGQSNYRLSTLDDTKNEAYALDLGYRWAITSYLDIGAEGGYAKLGDGYAGDTRLKLRGWMLGGNARVNLPANLYLIGRFGRFYSHTDIAQRDDRASKVHGSGNGYYAGVGVGYNILPSLGVGVSYDTFHSRAFKLSDRYVTTGMYSVNVEYRF
jgi:hypothetical protein